MANTTKERKAVNVADLPELEGTAKKEFDALQKAAKTFTAKFSDENSEIPSKHLRVLRREVSRELIQSLRGDQKVRLEERIKKLQERLTKMEK